jgi:MarR family
MPPDEKGGSWTLLTGHGRVLVEIAGNPEARIRDISSVVGLTERTVQAIVADLEAAGYLIRTRTGRRTHYTVNPDSQFRHSAQKGLRVGPLLTLLTAMGDADTSEPADPGTNPALPAAGDRRRGKSGGARGWQTSHLDGRSAAGH